jgi:5-methylcytosine-specific restriction endonuclease McrA
MTHLERMRKWRKANHERSLEINRASKLKNLEAFRASDRERARKYRAANPEKKRLANRAYLIAHRTELSLRKVARRAAQRSAGIYSAVEWAAIKKKQRNRCADCGLRRKLTVDHVFPISRGGCNYAFNLAARCHSCNAKKHDHILEGAEMSLFCKWNQGEEMTSLARKRSIPC